MKRFHAALVALTLTGSIALAAGIASASAAETGTKTMPDSSIYPPRMHAGLHNYRYARPSYRYGRPYYARPYYRYAGLYNYRYARPYYARPYYRYGRSYYARPYYRSAGLYNYPYARPYYARTVGRYYNYAPGDYQPHDPYYGTPFENVAPYSGRNPNNPYRGTRWYGVAPY
jgi:hypothetical protein